MTLRGCQSLPTSHLRRAGRVREARPQQGDALAFIFPLLKGGIDRVMLAFSNCWPVALSWLALVGGKKRPMLALQQGGTARTAGGMCSDTQPNYHKSLAGDQGAWPEANYAHLQHANHL